MPSSMKHEQTEQCEKQTVDRFRPTCQVKVVRFHVSCVLVLVLVVLLLRLVLAAFPAGPRTPALCRLYRFTNPNASCANLKA